jgi:hypothetical protein
MEGLDDGPEVQLLNGPRIVDAERPVRQPKGITIERLVGVSVSPIRVIVL